MIVPSIVTVARGAPWEDEQLRCKPGDLPLQFEIFNASGKSSEEIDWIILIM